MAARCPRAARRLSCWHMSDQDVRQMAPDPGRLELGPDANDQRSPFRAERRVQTAGSWASRWSARACSSACSRPQANPLSPSASASARTRRWDPRRSRGGRPSGSAGPWRRGQTSRRAGQGRARRPLPRGGHVWRPCGSRAGTRRVAARGTPSAPPGKHPPGGLRQRQAWRTVSRPSTQTIRARTGPQRSRNFALTRGFMPLIGTDGAVAMVQ